MLFPCAKVTVAGAETAPHLAVRADGWAWFMVVMFLGGIVVELTMDRARYPREYPPAFVYVTAAYLVASMIIETRRTRKAVRRALATQK